MRDVLQFAILGLGAGTVYVLLAQGIVLVYRSSGVVNFAHGAMAMVGGFVFLELHQSSGWAYGTSLAGSVLAVSLLGALIYQLVIRPLKRASPLARVIATLGILTVLQSLATLRYQSASFSITQQLPDTVHRVWGIAVPEDRLWLVGLAAVVTALIWAASRYTRVGLATSAVAENERSAAALGWSPDLIATTNWALGGAMAALAAVAVFPLTGLSVQTATFLVIPALAVALVGRFRSFPLVLVGGLAMGIVQSELTRYVSLQGASQAAPLLVIVVILALSGTSLPLRGHLLERLPALGGGRFRPAIVLPLTVVVAFVIGRLSPDWQLALSTSFIAALMLLSVVVLTGYAGQLSLAQYALGGVGALVAGQLVHGAHWPLVAAIVAGVAAAVVLGLAFALPALRARGISLAIVTLGLGYAMQQVVFNRAAWTGSDAGLQVGPQTVFGISVDGILEPGNYAVFALVCFVLCAWMVSNVRRGRTGRQLIAVRTNERAAASLGVNVFGAKMYAFALSAATAGLAGILLGFQSYSILFGETFDPFNSINAVTLAVLGGVGYVLGPLFGATLAPGGFPGGLIAQSVGDGAEWLVLIGGVAVILILTLNPDGLARENIRLAQALTRRVLRRTPRPATAALLDQPAPARRTRETTFTVRGLGVRFGGVVALDDVSLEVKSGEVVGLIGPNGAGKTTLIDAVTGFVQPSAGTIELDGTPIDRWPAYRRARAGLTRSFQSLELFDDVTVLDNLRAASDPRDLGAYVTDLVHPGDRPLPAVAAAAVREFELEEYLHRRAEELPYGKRRLVAIARAVAAEASVLLLDEPAAGLSEAESAELGRLIRRLADEWGLAILLIEHDVAVVMRTCDRVVVLDFGRKIADAAPDVVRRDQTVRAAYLGGELESDASPPVRALARAKDRA